jgi:hypothetical protein
MCVHSPVDMKRRKIDSGKFPVDNIEPGCMPMERKRRDWRMILYSCYTLHSLAVAIENHLIAIHYRRCGMYDI